MMEIRNKPVAGELDGVEIQYHGGRNVVHAVQGASVRIEAGQTVGVVGESGSGKSTIARALLGLLDPDRSSLVAGRLVLDGKDVSRLTPKEWQKIRGNPAAMVFQDPLTYLNPVMSVGKQIAESIRLHDPKADRKARVAELLELVKLPQTVAKSYPDELSGGMRQRVLMAIALACRPKLLIADEPTTALDVTTQAEIMELLADLQQKMHMAMLLISHDLGLVASMCEKVYVMYAGRTIEWGPAAEIFHRPSHPYTRGLIAAAEGRRTKDGRFSTIGGDVPDMRNRIKGCPFAPRCGLRHDACSEMPEAKGAGPGHMVRCHADPAVVRAQEI